MKDEVKIEKMDLEDMREQRLETLEDRFQEIEANSSSCSSPGGGGVGGGGA
jgi:hypothetical protein